MRAGNRCGRPGKNRLDRPGPRQLLGHQRAVAADDRYGNRQPTRRERLVDGIQKIAYYRHKARVEQGRRASADDVGLCRHRRRLDNDLPEPLAQKRRAALLDNRTVIERVQAGDAERIRLLEESRVLLVKHLPIR